VAKVFTAGHACHSFAISTTGVCFGWGRNENQQLGSNHNNPLPTNVHLPTVIEGLGADGKSLVRSAAVGKSHSLLLLQSGEVYAAGFNKSGQCGVKTSIETIPNFRKCVFAKDDEDEDKIIVQVRTMSNVFFVGSDGSPLRRPISHWAHTSIVSNNLLLSHCLCIQVACGEDFSVALCDEGYMYTTGSSEFGQLANGATGEHFITANKIAFANETSFSKRTTFCHAPTEKLYTNNDTSTKVVPLSEDVRIQQVACGKHHALALEADADSVFPRVFSWGCGDYGVLGHGVQADEYFPRCVGVLAHTRMPLTGPSHLAIAAGQHCSLLQAPNGHVYYWGKHRPVGEATMRPTLVDALANNQHVVTETAAGGQSVVCSTANGQTVAWGQCLHGGLGLDDKKSSAKPTFVPGLDSCRVVSLACGYGHSLFVVRDDDKEDKAAIQKIPVLDPSATENISDTAPPAAKGKPKKK
jgi:alpha-tubulin suppressor-like RCC1 family protein